MNIDKKITNVKTKLQFSTIRMLIDKKNHKLNGLLHERLLKWTRTAMLLLTPTKGHLISG